MKKLRLDAAINNSYSTTITSGMKGKMSSIATELEKIMILNGTDSDSLRSMENGQIIVLTGTAENVPAFAHPFYSNDKVFIDARPFTNREGGIKDSTEFNLLYKRAIVELCWIEDRVEWASQADFVVDVFATWFADGITRRLNMTMVENQQLRILAAIYYLRTIYRYNGHDKADAYTTLLRVLPRMLRVPINMIQEITDVIGEENIADMFIFNQTDIEINSAHLDKLCTHFNDLTDNAYKLNKSLVFQCLVRGAFICANSPEITSVAIEFPALMYLLIWYCTNKGIQGKTAIGLKVQALGRRHTADKFNRFMEEMFQEFTTSN